MRKIPGETRRKILETLRANGVDTSRANETVDLALHAASQALEATFAVCDRGRDAGVKVMAMQIAAQISAWQLTHLAEMLAAKGAENGVSSGVVEVVV